MRRTRLDRRLDEALLTIAFHTAFLYARRRIRRMFARFALGALVTGGVAIATAGVGVVLALGAASAYRRRRGRRSVDPSAQTAS